MKTIITALNNSGVLQVTLDRADKLNALNDTMLGELDEVFTEAGRDPQTKAILITGKGKAFCAGADINRLAEANPMSGYEFAKQGQAVFSTLENLAKPSLAAVNGFAFGGGCELALSASLRIASEKAQFGQPEVKLGVIPGYGGTQRLARLVGKGRALDLCLSGRFIDAKLAESWGLVTSIAAPDQLIDDAHTILNNIITMAPLAIRSLLTVINQGFDLPLNDALELEASHFAMTCGTEDKNEGVNAFLQKRSAHFKGK